MGSDDLFKKRKAGRKKRKYEYRQPKANSFLIVTEGERTEPLYFKGIVRQIEKKLGGNVDVVEMPIVDIKGEGRSTNRLIEKTDEIVNKAKIMYQEIWVVFDRDDFADFDSAIAQAEKKGYRVAWSNSSFEYWLYLHFDYSDSDLHRHEWNKKLDEIFRKRKLRAEKYQKNDKDIYDIVSQNEGVDRAIHNARRRMSEYHSSKCKPSEFTPGTTVYLLVEKLKGYLDEAI